MNKQEAIKELKAKKDKNERLFELEDWDEGFKCGAGEALNDALFIVKQLDEPEKPVVPKFVADFYESINYDFEHEVYDLCVKFHYSSERLSCEIKEWFNKSENNPIQTLVAMHKYGYEVEKEKLYYVEIPSNSKGYYYALTRNHEGTIILVRYDNTMWKVLNSVKLTESEIKKDFDWAWQFAEEVKE